MKISLNIFPKVQIALGYGSRLAHETVVYAIYHYGDVLMGAIVSQITSLTIVYSTVYSDAD